MVPFKEAKELQFNWDVTLPGVSRQKTHRYTPLHVAVDMKVASSINVMLKNMARFDYAVLRTFGRILPELIQYSAFKELIEAQSFSTT